MMNLHVDDKVHGNPHAEFLSAHDLWRGKMPLWLQEAGRAIHQHMSAEQQKAVCDYAFMSFLDIWKYYDPDTTVGSRKSAHAADAEEKQNFEAFDSIWSCSELFEPVFDDMVLFEGQGVSENDFLHAKVGDTLIRQRPTSTSWSVNAAMSFVSSDDRKPAVLLVHHIRDPKIKALLLQEKMKRGARPWMECEVLLQPNLLITVEKESEEFLDSYNLGRSGKLDFYRELKVLHTNVQCNVN